MTSNSRTRGLTAGLASLALLSLTGCAVSGAASGAEDASNGSLGGTSGSSGSNSASYADGTYTVEAGYRAPSGQESIQVTLTIADGSVTDVASSAGSADREAAQFQRRFASAIRDEVLGRDLATLSVSRVAGASLTAHAFDAALDQIRSQAS
jgi:hypothetical protein